MSKVVVHMSTKLEMLDVQAVKTWESYQRFKESIAEQLLKYSSRTVSTAPKSWEGLRKILAEEEPDMPEALSPERGHTPSS